MSSAYFFAIDKEYVSNGVDPKFKFRDSETDKFFRFPIAKNLEIWETEFELDWQYRLIKFFDKENVVLIACGFNSTDADYNNIEAFKILRNIFNKSKFDFENESKFLWIKGELNSTSVLRASKFLRQSDTLKVNEFKTISAIDFVADGSGAALFDKFIDFEKSTDRVNRLQLVISLACAYQVVLNKAIDDLALAATNDRASSELKLRKWARFLSANYFKEPINTSSTELIHCYAYICERQRIDIQYKEVTDQLKLLADLVLIDRAEVAQKQAAKAAAEFAKQSAISTEKATENARLLQEQSIEIAAQSKIISSKGLWVTRFAALLAVASIAQCTPKSLGEFYQGWKCPVFNFVNVSTDCKLPIDDKKQAVETTLPKQKLKAKQ
jgi:hypothetical protein